MFPKVSGNHLAVSMLREQRSTNRRNLPQDCCSCPLEGLPGLSCLKWEAGDLGWNPRSPAVFQGWGVWDLPASQSRPWKGHAQKIRVSEKKTESVWGLTAKAVLTQVNPWLDWDNQPFHLSAQQRTGESFHVDDNKQCVEPLFPFVF